MKKAVLALPLFFALAVTPRAGAITLQFANGVNDTSTSSTPNCNNLLYGAVYTDCTTSAFISDSLAGPNDYFLNLSTFGGGSSLGEESFASALASAYGSQYTVNYSPNGLANVTLTVTSFSTFSNFNVGGISNLTVSVSGNLNNPGDPSVDQLMWIQGLETNYQPGLPGNSSFGTSNNFNVMDTSEFDGLGACQNTVPDPNNVNNPDTVPANTGAGGLLAGSKPYCGPIYPYQYGNVRFADAPAAPWPNGSFRAIALLGTIDSQTNVITVYGGVNYGFDNMAPEPGTWVLLLTGLSLCLILARRNARRA